MITKHSSLWSTGFFINVYTKIGFWEYYTYDNIVLAERKLKITEFYL